ncbi:MAG: site-specific integrase [Chloroflexi bacterium]|nr:MAG: site-specific integrase [Chloroflexota bacterium]
MTRRTHGEGTVYRDRASHRAQARIDGVRIGASGLTPQEARKNLKAKIQEHKTQLARASAALTAADYLRRWVTDLKDTQAVRPRTYRRYESIITIHLEPLIGHVPLAGLTRADVTGLFRSLHGRLSTTSQHHVHAVLHTALEQAVVEGLVEHNVARLVKAPPMRHRDKVILDSAKARRLISAARGEPLGAAVFLGIATGMREGEILGLRRCDVLLERNQLRIERTGNVDYDGCPALGEPKTDSSRRTVDLSFAAVEVLSEHLAAMPGTEPTRLLFPSPTGAVLPGPDFLKRYFRPITRKAGLPDMPFHDLRHSAGTILKERGVDEVTISRILGHASPAITAKFYGHVTPPLLAGAMAKMEEALGDPATGTQTGTQPAA